MHNIIIESLKYADPSLFLHEGQQRQTRDASGILLRGVKNNNKQTNKKQQQKKTDFLYMYVTPENYGIADPLPFL